MTLNWSKALFLKFKVIDSVQKVKLKYRGMFFASINHFLLFSLLETATGKKRDKVNHTKSTQIFVILYFDLITG